MGIPQTHLVLDPGKWADNTHLATSEAPETELCCGTGGTTDMFYYLTHPLGVFGTHPTANGIFFIWGHL